ENGASSRFARVFDIAWQPVKGELADKVLIPILGDQYGAVLEQQELQLSYEDGRFLVRYHDNVFPIAPDTFDTILTVDLDAWLEARNGSPEADELLSIITSIRNLPPRTTRDSDEMATRDREKEIIKRRLGALAGRSAEVRSHIETAVTRFNGIVGEPRSFD